MASVIETDSSNCILRPVCEIPVENENTRYPWDHSTGGYNDFVSLDHQMTSRDVGTVMAQLCHSNGIEPLAMVSEIGPGLLAAHEEHQALILAGGIQVQIGDSIINPGCCCGLENWREWQELPETRSQVWWGHDPDGWVDLVNDRVVQFTQKDWGASISLLEYNQLMQGVATRLERFLIHLDEWLTKHLVAAPSQIVELFANEMHI